METLLQQYVFKGLKGRQVMSKYITPILSCGPSPFPSIFL